MANTHLKELWAELRAIRFWDQDQLERGCLDEIELISWSARRIREREIWDLLNIDWALQELSRLRVIGRA